MCVAPRQPGLTGYQGDPQGLGREGGDGGEGHATPRTPSWAQRTPLLGACRETDQPLGRPTRCMPGGPDGVRRATLIGEGGLIFVSYYVCEYEGNDRDRVVPWQQVPSLRP